MCFMAFVSGPLSIDALKFKTIFQISEQNVIQLEVQEVAFVQASVVKVNYSFVFTDLEISLISSI